ncbi:MAG: hypothetical protein C4291_15850 [Candidatus Dadabacteria bacterium]
MDNKQYGIITTIVVIAALLGGVFGSVLTYTFTAKPSLARETLEHEPVIRAEGFVLVDKKDRTRAMLILDKDNPNLIFYGKNGKPRIGLSILPDGQSSVVVADKNGKVIWSVP